MNVAKKEWKDFLLTLQRMRCGTTRLSISDPAKGNVEQVSSTWSYRSGLLLLDMVCQVLYDCCWEEDVGSPLFTLSSSIAAGATARGTNLRGGRRTKITAAFFASWLCFPPVAARSHWCPGYWTILLHLWTYRCFRQFLSFITWRRGEMGNLKLGGFQKLSLSEFSFNVVRERCPAVLPF